ncbi:hypothetical protein RND81_10G082000 [Saponaria officinalis]|uniref:Enhancer of polycomb-like protein n=1 Tax=Saponaria officinalis TaxID=3572 RepID=A0AAW1I1S3_SAPOF
MLMEDRVEISHSAENVVKSESLDLQRVYNERPWVSGVKKRSSRSSGSRNNGVKRKLDSEDLNGSRKKIRKEVLLTSLSSRKKNKKTSGQLGKEKAGLDQKGNSIGGDGGLAGISLRLNGDVNIPKRPRDLVRRKKVEVDLASKEEGVSGIKPSVGDGNVKSNGDVDGSLHHSGNGSGLLAHNGESGGVFSDGVVGKMKIKTHSDDHKEDRSSMCSLDQHLKRENSDLSVRKGDSLLKKARRLRKKVKETRLANLGVSKEVGQVMNRPSSIVDETSRIADVIQDDEENLEENAARMLSSRFDPSCTGFSSCGSISRLPLTNGLSDTIFSNSDTTRPISLAESNIASSDGGDGAGKPRDQQNGKSMSKIRRRFYEVLCRDCDSYWLLNRRIKVFWPLDKSWYLGHVIGYDSEKELHHVKYDDREEEWIDLQNERFKLFLFPSEVPGKVGKKQSTTQDEHSQSAKKVQPADMELEQDSNNYMDSEPIISWLGRSSLLKPPSVGIRKRQRISDESTKSSLSLAREGKTELIENLEQLEVKSFGGNVNSLANGSDVQNNPSVSLSDVKLLEPKAVSNNKRSLKVYFRRRFHKRSQQPSTHVPDLCQSSEELPLCETSKLVDSLDLGVDLLLSMAESCCPCKRLGLNEFIWDVDVSGRLNLIIPVTSLKVLRCELSLPVPFVDNNLFGSRCYNMHQRGDLISLSPMVRLEILFVDNSAGLRFLLFEGCLMQAVSFVFLVLVVFQSNKNYSGQQLPATSVRFQFSGLRSLAKQLVFTFYNFTEVVSSKWSYLDRKLIKHCVLTKHLPPPECTYDNISALRNGCQLPFVPKHATATDIHEGPMQQGLSKSPEQSSVVKLSRVTSDIDDKLLSFALRFAAAPKFFVSLHLKLLMEHSLSSSSLGEQDLVSSMDCSVDNGGLLGADKRVVKDNTVISNFPLDVSSGAMLSSKSNMESCLLSDLGDNVLSVNIDEVIAKPSCSFSGCPENEDISQIDKKTSQVAEPDHCALPREHFSDDNQLSSVAAEVGCDPKANLAIEIPSPNSNGSLADGEVRSAQHHSDSAVVSNDGVVHSSSPTPQSEFHSCKISDVSPSASACLSPSCSGRKADFLRNGLGTGPKKPRTQVSYSTSHVGTDFNNKNNFLHGKGFSHKRIRRANEKKTLENFGTSTRNMEAISCLANCLVTVGDRGWRECGARVVLELVNDNEWRLAVKMSGDTKYSHKAHQFLQPGSTNRYTHAMMWKGGKDWILEFTDRSQWTIFKEMHEECYNRNLRAASMKNIPIPGVRLIEETDDFVPDVPYMRPSPKYHRQLETDVDIAMNPSHVLYDMDSDDEQWVIKHRGLDSNEHGYEFVSDEMFEKIMDAFEKYAYANQCDHFSLDELEDIMTGFGPVDLVINIYEYWREKRQRKGMPLIRHLQPPLWEKYQQQVKEWEQAALSAPPSGSSENPAIVEKPAMFAFCLKPRGLEMPHRGSKHRPQKKLPIGFLSHGVLGDPDSLHSPVGRRLHGFPLGDDRLVCSAYNQGISEFSPVLHGSTRSFSPRDAGGSIGYFSLNNDGFERNYYSKRHKIKSKRLSFIPPYCDQFASFNHRTMNKRSTGHMRNMGSAEWPSQMNYQPDGFQRHNIEQVSPSVLDEFRLRDAASAARHAVSVAKLKRENARRMLCRADLAMHKAVAAIMTAEAVKASYTEPNDDDVQTSG